jgi:DedD protein
MGFLSKVITDQKPDVEGDVSQVRGRARRRLIGAAVLLAVGVIGFPLLFETQPRPVAADAPQVVPGKDKGLATTMPAKVTDRSASALAAAASAAATAASKPLAPAVITERAQDAGREVPAAVVIPVPSAVPPAPAPDSAKLAKDKADKERAEKARVAKERAEKERAERAERDRAAKERAEEERRARGALEGRAATTKPTSTDVGRFAVQVGAYASDSGVREVRTKLERVGLRSYTQLIKANPGSGSNGNTTRVRAGPYASRAEAEKAAEKARSVGLTPSIIPLGP